MRIGSITLTTLLLVAPACSDGGGDLDQAELPDTIDRALVLYRNYEVLAARGGDPVAITVDGVRTLDLDDDTLGARIDAELSGQSQVIPYMEFTSRNDGGMWLQVHAVDKDRMFETSDYQDRLREMYLAVDNRLYERGWVLSLSLATTDGDLFRYHAFVLEYPPADELGEPAFTLVDPVALGVDRVPVALPIAHTVTGASQSGSWQGCAATHTVVMTQGTLQHMDSGTCWLNGSYNCFDDGKCDDEAKAVIMCDIVAPTCPRLGAMTVKSGSCDTNSGGSENCWFSDCQVGTGQHSMESKSDTQLQGEHCAVHTNVEVLIIGGSTAWEITYTTPKTPLGSVQIKWKDSAPSHSGSQTYQQLNCCQKVPAGGGTGEPQDPDPPPVPPGPTTPGGNAPTTPSGG